MIIAIKHNIKIYSILKDITPIETYKVETIDTVSFENSHLANLRDLDQNSNVQLSHTTPPGVSDLHPNTPGTVESSDC